MDPMRAKWGLMIAIVVSMGALWGIDVFLARTERLEVSGEARRDYEAGSALLTEGRATDALDPLRKAHALGSFESRIRAAPGGCADGDWQPG